MRRAAILGLVALGLLIGLSLFVGVIGLSPNELWRDREAFQLLVVSRLPRTLAAVIAGASLAVTGTIMQMLVRNRFVEPATAGTGQGAAAGILIATLIFPAASLLAKMTLAALCALISSFGFLAIVHRLPPTQPLLVPLVGMIYGGIWGAGVVFVAYQADLLQYIDIWMNGEFSGVLKGRYELIWVAALVAGLAYLVADQFAIVGMGRVTSVSLGLNYRQVVAAGLVAIAIVTSLTVVTVGMIPFIGLVVPNLTSRLLGDNLRRTLPITALFGAILVLAADILGRLLRYPFEIPVGTVFGVVGAVVFLWLLYGRHGDAR